jgi:hypothetical protein
MLLKEHASKSMSWLPPRVVGHVCLFILSIIHRLSITAPHASSLLADPAPPLPETNPTSTLLSAIKARLINMELQNQLLKTWLDAHTEILKVMERNQEAHC